LLICFSSHDKTSADYFHDIWRQFTSSVNKNHIPYALALGNHDIEGFVNGTDILTYDFVYG